MLSGAWERTYLDISSDANALAEAVCACSRGREAAESGYDISETAPNQTWREGQWPCFKKRGCGAGPGSQNRLRQSPEAWGHYC
jgi:hypothetical protein